MSATFCLEPTSLPISTWGRVERFEDGCVNVTVPHHRVDTFCDYLAENDVDYEMIYESWTE